MSARTHQASSATLEARGHTLHTINYSAEKSDASAFGVNGYRLPKHGLPPRQPIYSVPKDKLQNFLQLTQKRGKALPAPS